MVNGNAVSLLKLNWRGYSSSTKPATILSVETPERLEIFIAAVLLVSTTLFLTFKPALKVDNVLSTTTALFTSMR